MQKVMNILDAYTGETECRLRCTQKSQTYMYKHGITANNLLFYELQTVLPENDIKLVWWRDYERK